jgi:hypothetical protein
MAIGDAISRNLGTFSFRGKTLVQRLLVPTVWGLDAIMSAGPIERDEEEGKGSSAGSAAGTGGVVLFALANALMFACLLLSTPVFGAYTLLLIVVALLLHFLCFQSVLLVIKEDTHVWNGLLADQDRAFKNGKNIKNPAVLFVSAIFFFLFVSIFAQQWDQSSRHLFIVKLPNIGCEIGVCRNAQYLLAILYEIPIVGWVLRAIAPGGAAEFSSVPGAWLRVGIDVMTATYIFGVFKDVYFQRKSINDLITAFERSSSSGNAMPDATFLGYLLQRAERAPDYILGQLFESALSRPNDKVRLAYVRALFIAKIYSFVPVFVDKLDREKSPDNQRSSLDELIKLIKTDGRRFTPEVTVNTFNALSKQMKIEHKITVQEKLNEASLALVELGWQVKSLSSKRMKRLLSLVKERGSADIRMRLRELLSRMSISQNARSTSSTRST